MKCTTSGKREHAEILSLLYFLLRCKRTSAGGPFKLSGVLFAKLRRLVLLLLAVDLLGIPILLKPSSHSTLGTVCFRHTHEQKPLGWMCLPL